MIWQHLIFSPPRQSASTHATKLWGKHSNDGQQYITHCWKRPTKTFPTGPRNPDMVWTWHWQPKLTALSTLAAQQTKPNKTTLSRLNTYRTTFFPGALIWSPFAKVTWYTLSTAILSKEATAWNQSRGHHYLSTHIPFPTNNGAILTVSKIIIAVMSSTAEAELGAHVH